MACWARSRGDCKGGITREHIVSKGLFTTGGVRVKGLHWCPDGAVDIGLGAAVVKNACAYHNSSLSRYDMGAIALQAQVDELVARADGTRPDPIPTLREIKLDLVDIERWAFKTMVNTLCAAPETHRQSFRIADFESPPGEVHRDLVDAVFDRRPFPAQLGIYLVSRKGAKVIHEKDKVLDMQFYNVVTPHGAVAGVGASIVGIRFVLWLDRRSAPPFRNLARNTKVGMWQGNAYYNLRVTHELEPRG